MCMTDCGNEEGKLLVVGIGSSIKNVISTLNNEHGKYHLLYMGEDGANSDGIDFYDMTFLLDDLNTTGKIPGRHKTNICEFLFAFVTSPFKFEGRSRVNLARLIINDLYPLVDSLIWIDLESTKIGHEESTKGIQASIDHKDSMMVSTIRALSDIINPLQIDLSIPYGSLSENGNICIPVVEDLRNGKYKKAIENAFKRLLIGTNGMPLPRVLVINILCSGEPQLKLDDLNTISATIDSFLPPKTHLEFHLCPINSSSRVLELVMFGCGYTQNDLLIINEEIWKPTKEEIRQEEFRQRYKTLRLRKVYEESEEISPYDNTTSCPRCHTPSTELEWEKFYWFDCDGQLLIEHISAMCPKCHRRVFSDAILHDNVDDKE